MRKALLVLGIIFLLVGVFLASYSRLPTEKIERPMVNRAEGSWEVSGNLSNGEKIIVGLVPSEGWSRWAYELFPGHTYKVNVSVIIEDPLGEEAEFIISYEPPPPGYDPVPGKPLPIFLASPSPFKLVRKGSLIVDEPLDCVGGLVTQNGTYNVRVVQTWWTEGPPERVEIHKEVFGKEYPYTKFLPIGVGLCICGVATLVLRAKFSKPKTRAKLKKFRK